MTQSLGAIQNMLFSRLAIMKKAYDYHEKHDDSVNKEDVSKLMTERYLRAVQAYMILDELVTDGYETVGDWGEPEWFEDEEVK